MKQDYPLFAHISTQIGKKTTFFILVFILTCSATIFAKPTFGCLDFESQFSDPMLRQTITKTTSASQLDAIVAFYKKENVDVVFSKVKRNRDYEIIKIKIKITYGKNKVEMSTQDNTVIETFTIEGTKKGNEIVKMYFDKPQEITTGHNIFVSKINETAENEEELALQRDHDKKVYQSVQNDKMYVVGNNTQNNENQTIIIHKNDESAVDDKTGFEIVNSLVKNTSVDLKKALIFLNEKPVTVDDLNIIKNQDGLTMIISDAEEGMKKYGKQGENGVIEIFKNDAKMENTSSHQNVQSALKMMQEARKNMNISDQRTTQIQMSAEKSDEKSQDQKGTISNDRIKIVEDDLKAMNANKTRIIDSKTETVDGRSVITNNIMNKSGFLIKATTTVNELDAYKKMFEREDLQFEYKNLERNKFGMITGIQIILKSNQKEVTKEWKTIDFQKGIPNIFVGRINGDLSVNNIE